MPGILRPDSECPKCGDGLMAIVDTSNYAGVTREYYHQRGSPKARLRRKCIKRFSDHDEAATERRGLEVPQ